MRKNIQQKHTPKNADSFGGKLKEMLEELVLCVLLFFCLTFKAPSYEKTLYPNSFRDKNLKTDDSGANAKWLGWLERFCRDDVSPTCFGFCLES